jgi:hypothetical protein
MTVDDVKKELEEIKRSAGDNEAAHQLEDWLFVCVLRAIASGAEDASGLATEALKAGEIEFVRWYA